MPYARITSRGRMTIPKPIRDGLGLKPGDRVEIRLEPNGTARMIPATLSLDAVFGILNAYKKKKAVTVKGMDQAIRRHLRGKSR